MKRREDHKEKRAEKPEKRVERREDRKGKRGGLIVERKSVLITTVYIWYIINVKESCYERKKRSRT